MYHLILHVPRRLAQGLITVYQKTISFDHGWLSHIATRPMCRYHPTCSQYGYEAIGRFGLIHGGWMTFKRIVRCNPWTKGGLDPVPKD